MELTKQEITRKWVQLNWRLKTQTSYIRKNITNEFTFAEFAQHLRESGYINGYCLHRPNPDKNYCRTNLEFVSKAEHYLITAREKRRLTDSQVQIARLLYKHDKKNWSQRKLAKHFKISQPSMCRIVNYIGYLDVEDISESSFDWRNYDKQN